MARRGTLIAYVRRDDSRGGAPLVPASWDLVEETSRWSTIYPLGRIARPDVFFHARRMVTHPTLDRAVYVCVGAPVVLQHLADRIAADGLAWTLTWDTLADLRDDARPAVSALRDAWIDERPEGDTGSHVRLFARIAGFEDDDAEEGGK